jgi:hypothetical protein
LFSNSVHEKQWVLKVFLIPSCSPSCLQEKWHFQHIISWMQGGVNEHRDTVNPARRSWLLCLKTKPINGTLFRHFWHTAPFLEAKFDDLL